MAARIACENGAAQGPEGNAVTHDHETQHDVRGFRGQRIRAPLEGSSSRADDGNRLHAVALAGSSLVVMETSAKFRGGLRNRRGNVTWPFATMLVTTGQVTLRSPPGGAEIPTGTRHAQRWRGLTAAGVRFTDEGSLATQ